MAYDYRHDMNQGIPDFSEATKTSKYSGGIDQLKRLNLLYLIAMSRRHSGKLEEWRWVLDSVEIELHPDMKRMAESKNTKINWIEKINKINKKINEAFKNRDPSEQYKYLKIKEKIMRWVQDKAGKGTKLAEEEESLF